MNIYVRVVSDEPKVALARVWEAIPYGLRAMADAYTQMMEEEPPLPTYPLAWPPKVRRAYFAKRRGVGLPYQRLIDPQSERLETSFRVRGAGLQWEVWSPVSYAVYVMGHLQARWHRITGWKTIFQRVTGNYLRVALEAFRRQFRSVLKWGLL